MPLVLAGQLAPTLQDIQQAQAAVRALSEGRLEVAQLPDMARELLSQILTELASGNSLSVVPVGSDLTTSQAASYLNVSRPYLTRLLDEGRLPFHFVGSHKRIRLRDVTRYKQRQDEASDAALAELQRQAQALDMGY